MEIDVKGRRRVSWDRNKGRVKNFKWATRACKELGKGKLGLGSNKLVAQLPISKSSLGQNAISPKTFESRECSNNFVGPIFSAIIHEKVGESPLVISTSSKMLIQVAGGPVRTQKEWVRPRMEKIVSRCLQ